MDKLLKKKAIYRVEPPPETIDGWERHLEQEMRTWGKYFKNDTEREFFCMLPLNFTQKATLLESLKAEQEFENELQHCEGDPDSSTEHRQRCVACVYSHRPSIAKPLF